VREVAWGLVLPQLAILLSLMALGGLLWPSQGPIPGAILYLGLSYGLKYGVARDHKAGLSLVRRGNFEGALQRFRQSLRFFEQYPWVDRYRPVTLLSPSRMSYTEMALLNMAFCEVQLGRRAEARALYETCLTRFPDSVLAASSLRMMGPTAGQSETRH
jgi:tetratricopeptide (TPR) repeat protein